MQKPSLGSVVVPEGHALTTYPLTLGSSVGLSSGGLLIAELGYVGDDYEVLARVFDRVNVEVAAWGADPPRATVVDGSGTLSDLFSTSLPQTRSVVGGIVWTASLNGLDALLEDATERERLVQRFLRLSRFPQWLIVDRASADTEIALRRLEAQGVTVRQGQTGQPFLLEVRRPDQRWLSAFAGLSAAQASSAAGQTTTGPQLFRAPRLRRLLVEATARDTGVELYHELVARKHPLPFLCGAQGQVSMMKWPERAGPFLPVFADLESVERGARELGSGSNRAAIAWLRPRELFAWAARGGFGLALAAFPNASSVRYWAIDPPTIAALLARMS